jgi:hypothetical protein
MKQLDSLPEAYSRYRDAGGVLEFKVFEVEDAGEATVAEAIMDAIRAPRNAAHTLLELGSTIIDREDLFGGWYDSSTKLLIMRGELTFADGRVLTDPPLIATDGNIVMSRSPVRNPDLGSDLAFAFALPIDGLRLWRSEIQPLFDDIIGHVLPEGADTEIRDWHSPELPRHFSYFAAGPRSWGLFLFSIYLPAFNRLTIVSGAPWD